MAENNDFQAIEKISTAVDDSKMKIIFSSECIKAQAFLFAKLKKETERQKEIRNYISNSNIKIKSEIKIAEQELKSLNLAIENIKYGNIELKKEHLLSKDNKSEILERIKTGTKKYENLWLEAKKRYESIPYVQELIQADSKSLVHQANINTFTNESKYLKNQINLKKVEIAKIDRARVLDLAEYFINERPKIHQRINELNIKITDISEEIEIFLKDKPEMKNISLICNEKSLSEDNNLQVAIKNVVMEDDSSKIIHKDTFELPSLHLFNNDLDLLRTKLDEIKKVNLQDVILIKRAGSSDFETNSHKKIKIEENYDNCYISPYFNTDVNENSYNDGTKIQSKMCSDKKLINIIENIRLDENDTYKLIQKLKPNQFQEINYIGLQCVDKSDRFLKSTGKRTSVVIREIEEIDLTMKKDEDDALSPPSQFLDTTQKIPDKKTITNDIPQEEKVISIEDVDVKADESQDKILSNSTTDEQSYATIKDMMLKKHNLDLSPQFVYGKNIHKQMQYEHKSKTNVIFTNNDRITLQKDCDEDDNDKTIKQDHMENFIETKHNLEISNDNNFVNSSPKIPINDLETPVEGILFKHGPQGIPDSLNVSISTTGFDDSEDFPHCVDSSILLSPSADVPTTFANSDNNDVLSQEVPNFLAGFRKTGLSLFGSTSDPKPDSSAQSQRSGFCFNFGNNDNKCRGGPFNMFH